MNITVKCFATLAKFQPPGDGSCEMPEGSAVSAVIERLGIDDEEVKIIFVNSVHAQRETVLKEDDRVGLFPAVGGG